MDQKSSLFDDVYDLELSVRRGENPVTDALRLTRSLTTLGPEHGAKVAKAFDQGEQEEDADLVLLLITLVTRVSLAILLPRVQEDPLSKAVLCLDRMMEPYKHTLLLLPERLYLDVLCGVRPDESLWWGYPAKVNRVIPEESLQAALDKIRLSWN